MTGTLLEPALLSDREVYPSAPSRRTEALSDRELEWSAARPLVVLLQELPSTPPSMAIEIREEGAADPLVEIREAIPEGAPRWLPRLAKRSAELLMLPEDWDTYGAACVEHRAVRYALRLLLLVSSSITPTPSLVPLPDGGVQVEWHVGGTDLEIEVAESGVLRVYFSGPGAPQEWESEFPASATQLEEIVAQLI